MAGRVRNKPHTQIGQRGKGKGRRKPRKTGPYRTAGLPLEVGQFPKSPPPIPNFLPNTAAFEHAQTGANDALSRAGSQYNIETGLIAPQMNLAAGRLKTDMGVAKQYLDEDLAARGIYDSSHRPQLYKQDIATPFGRAFQDLALGAAGQYANAGMGFGESLLGHNRSMFDAYNQRADDAFAMAPLSVPTGGYNLPHLPGPRLTTRNGGGRSGGGRTRPRRGNRPRGRR